MCCRFQKKPIESENIMWTSFAAPLKSETSDEADPLSRSFGLFTLIAWQVYFIAVFWYGCLLSDYLNQSAR